MSCMIRIRQIYPTLAINDRKLADFLLSHAEQSRHMSSQKLAEQAGVSQSSVVKFAQKLGYKGFPALKLAISETLSFAQSIPPVTVHNHILNTDSLRLGGEKLLAEKQSALQATLDINNEQRLQQALQMLCDARKIVLAGMGASGLVARDLAYKLLKIGVTAIAEPDTHVLLATVQALTEQDLLLAISFSGERKEICLAAQVARQQGVNVLSMTSFTPNSLQQQSHHCLYTVAELPATRGAAISSTTAQYSLTDLLFMGMVQKDAQLAAKRIKKSENLVNKLINDI